MEIEGENKTQGSRVFKISVSILVTNLKNFIKKYLFD